MKIDCISDLHGYYPELEGGDVLIVAGDLTSSDKEEEYTDTFLRWLIDLYMTKYEKIIWIAGNHDNWVQKNITPQNQLSGGEYLCDSGTEFQGLKIWGSPWTKRFEGINPNCMAFTVDTEQELADKFCLIPDDTDILVTHSPPYGARDRAKRNNKWGYDCVGSRSLQIKSLKLDLKLWVVGHIHEDYGIEPTGGILGGINCKLVNASNVNENYEPVNKPIRIIL